MLVKRAHATAAGEVNFAIQNYAMPDAMSMVNAKMAPVSVSPDGMESIARSKDARPVARITVSVASAAKDCGNVDAMMDGMVPIAPLHWNKIVRITKTTIKVCAVSDIDVPVTMS